MSKLQDFFKSDNSRTQIVKRNVLFSVGIRGISIIISMLLVPLTIDYVSSEMYGIWLTLSSIISWLSFFDVGFGLGLRNRLTTALATGDYKRGKVLVSTTYCILIIIFSVTGVSAFFLAEQINWCSLLNISISYGNTLVTTAQIIIVTFCASIIFKLIQNVFQAYQMTAASASVDTVSQVLSLALIFILTKTAFPNLNYLALVFCGAPIIVYVVFSVAMYCGRFKPVCPSVRLIDFSYAKDLFSLGGQFFLIQIICIILYQSVNFVISHYCGPEQVTIYNVAYKYFNCSLMVFNIIMVPLWTAYTDAIAKDDFVWMRSVYKRLVKFNIYIILGLLLMILLSPIVYRLWVGKSVDIPFWVSVMIGLYMMCQTISTLHATLLNGMNTIKLETIQAIMQGVIFVGSIIIIGKGLDLINILIIMLITAIIPTIILPIQVNLILDKKAKGIWNK